ncbi:hypothetical protein CDAR_14421 [Caerostris darwini]|uniref:Uncharacterized protein n=1 Tax=Caerostris darwini TaxID=1538125 RepID=A0AAV4QC68_9ARAC|nr:hypothetical protein CDAR_14421 [Caerostris darwini]
MLSLMRIKCSVSCSCFCSGKKKLCAVNRESQFAHIEIELRYQVDIPQHYCSIITYYSKYVWKRSIFYNINAFLGEWKVKSEKTTESLIVKCCMFTLMTSTFTALAKENGVKKEEGNGAALKSEIK